MKLIDGFMLRQIAGTWVVVPLGQRVIEFNGLMTLSDSGAFLWKMLERGAENDELLEGIVEEYEIDKFTAQEDIDEFIGQIVKKGIILQ